MIYDNNCSTREAQATTFVCGRGHRLPKHVSKIRRIQKRRKDTTFQSNIHYSSVSINDLGGIANCISIRVLGVGKWSYLVLFLLAVSLLFALSMKYNNRQQNHVRKNIKELHIAPMLNVSTIEFRNFMRILTKRCVIWTEMIVDETIFYNRQPKFDSEFETNCDQKYCVPQHLLPSVFEQEHPIICQIGGICPEWTAVATHIILEAGYNQGEINLNLDCPSTRVQGKQFGAALLRDVPRTIKLLETIRSCAASKNICVSVKCRIGIVDDETCFEWIDKLVKDLSTVCNRFIIHSRAVAMHGLSPTKNLSIPPLNYPWVYRLCKSFPNCDFIINGGISDLHSAKEICYGTSASLLTVNDHHCVPCKLCNYPNGNGSCVTPPLSPAPINLRGCMMGRAAIENPFQFALVDQFWYGIPYPLRDALTRRRVVEKYCYYLDSTYPRRCCDSEHNVVTHEIPAPYVTPTVAYCSICKDFRLSMFSYDTPCVGDIQIPGMGSKQRHVKIATRIIDRSLKPALGLFFQQDGSKLFRRQCDLLSRDLVVRNCGPAFILYQAVKLSISNHVLDRSVLDELPIKIS